MIVKDEFRKNELSFIPGGYSLTAITRIGQRLTYDKVKNVDAYKNKLIKDPEVLEILLGEEVIWKRS